MKPHYWFKEVEESGEISSNPETIEYLRMETGETFIHTGATAFWDYSSNCLNVNMLRQCGITHWRLRESPEELEEKEWVACYIARQGR